MHKLHFVTGKGGVGKSTIAAALARAAATRGERVLAIELGEPAGLTRALAGSSISVIAVDGASALAEYLTRRMHLGSFAKPILTHPLYRAFVAAAPGLRELVAIGKVRDEFLLQARWDVVVVDAGASGHAVDYLRMPATAALTFASGRVHREASANAALLRDPSLCAIHVVATPEEMPLAEAAETIAKLRALDLAIGRVIVNRCVPPAPPDVDAQIQAVADPVVREVLHRARGWERIQERGIAKLAMPVLRLPKVITVDVPRALAWPIGELLC